MCEKKEKETKKTFADVAKELGLNDEQIAFYQEMSQERSCYAYQRLAREKGVSSTIEEDWTYCGYYDAGFRGADRCSLNHPLRYVHIAKNKHTGEEIKFGIKCVTDFFNITPIQLRFIRAGFREANHEIEESLNMYIRYNGDFDEYEKVNHLVEKLNKVIDYDADLLSYSYKDDMENMMLVAEMRQMAELRIPFPSTFAWKIKSAYAKLPYEVLHPEVKSINDMMAEAADDDGTAQPVYVIDKEYDAKFGVVSQYLKNTHINLYRTVNRLFGLDSNKRTEKQLSFLKKLLDTDFVKIDDMFANAEPDKMKGFWHKAYEDLKASYELYGLSDKQVGLLSKCLQHT